MKKAAVKIRTIPTVREFVGTAVIVCAMLFGLMGTSLAGWHHKVVGRGGLIALTVDQSGTTHYLYQTLYGMRAGKIQHLAFNAQGKLVLNESLPSLAFYTEVTGDIAVDPQNHVHVVLSVIGSSGAIIYAFFDGSQWQTQNIPNSSMDCLWPTVAVDPQNNPHVGCFMEDAAPSGPYHFSYDGTAWTGEMVPVTYGADLLGPVFSRNPIIIESTGVIHFGAAVSDESKNDQNLVCDVVKNSGTWTSNCGCLGSPNASGLKLTMAVDSSGYPRFMYPTDTGPANEGIGYCSFDGTSFSAETISNDASDGWLAVDANDTSTAVLLFPKKPGSMTAAVAAAFGTLNDGAWSFQLIGAGPGLFAVALALDGNGLPRAGATAFDWYPVFAYFTPK